MKTLKIFWLTWILISGILALNHCYSQDNISIGIYQDARLLISGDDHGNSPGTIDVKLDISLQGNQFKHYYFEMRPQVEYANLAGGKYVSWLINGGWVFNKLVVDNLEAGAYLTIGAIHRFGGSFGTYGVSGDISYKLTNKLKLSFLGQIINRSDLAYKYNTNKPMKFNGYVGIKYNIL